MTESGKRHEAFVSVVVPVTDAEETIEDLIVHLHSVLQASFRSYEIVLIDNGSSDSTVSRIYALQQTTANLQLYTLNRRNEFEIAIIAGLDNAIGDFVFTLNHQTDPLELLPQMFTLAVGGSEMVCGTLREQVSRPVYRWGNRQYSRLLLASTGLRVPPGMSDLRLYSRAVLGYVNRNADRHLLLRVLPFMATTKIAIFPYNAIPGRGKLYRRNLGMSVLSSITVLLASSVAPLRALTLLTVAVSSLSLAYGVYVILIALLKRNVVEGWVSIALPMAVIFFFISTILGVLSEYIFRVVQHTRNSPVYLVTSESTSTTSDLSTRLNVVQRDGEFAQRFDRDRL